MARKEVGYIPNTRQPMIVPGTVTDDLIRRDFTLNALAKDEDGNIIDMFDGMWALENKILMTPQDAIKTFDDDALRIIRGVRFSITKGFSMHSDIINAIEHYDYESKMKVVSTERIREELLKCFKFDTLKTLSELNHFPKLRDYVFRNNLLWLKPTTEF
jgi:tRNA nucleotidyltransferase/poly(A) polymerase